MGIKRLALYECKWIVEIEERNNPTEFCWFAKTNDHIGIDREFFYQAGTCKTEQGAKRNWKTFAELNEFENWEWY